MYIRGMGIEIEKFAGMAQEMVKRAEDLMWQEILWMGKDKRFDIALDDMEDDVTFTKRHYSFASDKKNGLDKGLDWMLERMESTEGGRGLRKNAAWQTHSVKSYLRKIKRFKELLLFIVHLTRGQPARGTEITGIRFKNGFSQDRNIFVVAGQVVTVTRYHKSQAEVDTPKVIPRFLPWRVGQLLVMYIAYVQPFEELLAVKTYGSGWAEHVWTVGEGIWDTEKLSKIISRETSKALGVRLTTLSYRHAAAAIGRKKVGSRFAQGYQEEIGEIEEPEIDEEDPMDLAAARGSAVGQRRYGVSSDIIKHLSMRSIELFRPLCGKWHEVIGLSSYGTKGSKRGGEEMEKSLDRVRRAMGNRGRMFPVWTRQQILEATTTNDE